MQSKTVSANSMELNSWTDIKWHSVQKTVKRLRTRIFQATKKEDTASLQRYQQLMLRSKANLLLSIRKVTNIKILNIKENSRHNLTNLNELRWNLYLVLKNRKEKNWLKILQSNDPQKSVLNIKFSSTQTNNIINKVLQSVVEHTLEPEWIFKFKKSSHESRTSTHQIATIQQLRKLISKYYNEDAWVSQISLTSNLNSFSNEILLSKLAQFPAKKVVHQWLNSKDGSLLKESLIDTPRDKPENKILWPLLTKIKLYGIENIFKFIRVVSTTDGDDKESELFHLLRHQNKVFIIAPSEKQCKKVQEKFQSFLKKIEFGISDENVYTSSLSKGLKFLGYQLKTFSTLRKKIVVTPALERVFQLKEKIKKIWDKHKTEPPGVLISNLNRVLRKWASYYKTWDTHRSFRHLDFWMVHKAWRYGLRKHPNKGKKWIKNKYFPTQSTVKDKWLFIGHQSTNEPISLLKFRYLKRDSNNLYNIKDKQCNSDPSATSIINQEITTKGTAHNPKKQVKTYFQP